MAFNSLHFAIFFPIVLAAYFLTAHRFRWVLILTTSLYFYASWRPEFALLLVSAVAVAYCAAIGVTGATTDRRKSTWLTGGLTLLFGHLLIFKYFNFFNDSFRDLFTGLGLAYAIPALDLILPVGISYYTFQLASYVIDVSRGKIPAERHPGIFAAAMTFFPQLAAGPITRADSLLPQFHQQHRFDSAQAADGLKLMAWGLFKKMAVADWLARFVQAIYSEPQNYEGLPLILGTIAFALQVYCDFSGYSDIAIGAAQTMGFRLAKNFDRPYFATSIADFWKRWHISLSTWLTDYVYTPLTRSRHIKLPWFQKFLLCLLLTFLVSGLWHGAQWTYVFWGALHGTYLCCSMLTRRFRGRIVTLLRLDRAPGLHRALRIASTFSLVCLGYVFFRADSMGDALYIIRYAFHGLPWSAESRMLVQNLPAIESFAIGMLGVTVVLGADALRGYGSLRERLALQPSWVRWGFYYAQVTIIILGTCYQNDQQFIYFQF